MSVVKDVTSPSEDGTGGTRPVPLRRNRDYMLLWIGAGLSVLGMRAAAISYPLLLVFRNGDVVGAGLVGFAALLPTLICQIPAGLLVDRVPRRRLMIYCDLAGFLSMAGVAAVLLSGRLWLPQIMAAAFIEGTAAITYRLAERSAIRHILPEEQISAGLSQNEARGQASGLLGQPVGAGLFAIMRFLPFGLTALCHLLALCFLLLIHQDFEDERPEDEGPRTFRADTAEGFAWVWKDRILRIGVVLIAGSNIVFQVLAIGIVVIIRDGHGSPALVGVIGLIAGIGGVTGALTARQILKRLGISAVFIGTFLLWGVLLAVIAGTSNPVILAVLFGGMVFAGASLNVAAGIYQVKTTPDALQGRVGSVLGMVASGMNAVGAIVGGFSLHLFGTRHTLLAAACAMAAFGIIALATPAIRRAKFS
jgi:MFS family permease